jgi:hypothetical protein
MCATESARPLAHMHARTHARSLALENSQHTRLYWTGRHRFVRPARHGRGGGAEVAPPSPQRFAVGPRALPPAAVMQAGQAVHRASNRALVVNCLTLTLALARSHSRALSLCLSVTLLALGRRGQQLCNHRRNGRPGLRGGVPRRPNELAALVDQVFASEVPRGRVRALARRHARHRLLEPLPDHLVLRTALRGAWGAGSRGCHVAPLTLQARRPRWRLGVGTRVTVGLSHKDCRRYLRMHDHVTA